MIIAQCFYFESSRKFEGLSRKSLSKYNDIKNLILVLNIILMTIENSRISSGMRSKKRTAQKAP